MRSGRSFSLVATAAVLSLVPVTANAAPGGGEAPGADGAAAAAQAQPRPQHTDADGNHISDELDATIGTLGGQDRVEVIVMANGPAAKGRAQNRLGPADLIEPLPIVDGFLASVTVNQLQGLANMPGIARVQSNGVVTVANDSAQRDHGVTEARTQFSVDGSGVGVCVADTGLDPAHEQLDGPKIVGWTDVIGGLTTPYDDHGHGSHVAATAVGDGVGGPDAATYAGVAPGADLYGAKVLNNLGEGTDAQVLAGINWCANQAGVDIISLSLGDIAYTDGLDAMSVAVNNAVTVHGKTVVVAAGNSGDADTTVGSPGAAAQALTIGASAEWSGAPGTLQHSDGPYLAPFSGRGPTSDGRIKPDVVAPGVTITSALGGTVSGYTTLSGTSMATPFVAGLAALALEADPTLTPADIKNLAMSTARDLGSIGLDNQWGAGLIDGLAVVAAASGTDRSTPLPKNTHLIGTVPTNGAYTHNFTVTAADLGRPIALTLLIDGDFTCTLWLLGFCLLQDQEADLDVELRDPNGTLVQDSGCPLFNDCGTGGRQETIHVDPTIAGQYELQVFGFPDPVTGIAPGGTFEADLFVGPPPTPKAVPGGVGVPEGNVGSTVVEIPISLTSPSALPVSVNWETFTIAGMGFATSGVDYVADTGTLVFAPGQTEATVAVTVLGDSVAEPAFLWGEWFFVRFINPPSNATLDLSFFGLGVGVILDDD